LTTSSRSANFLLHATVYEGLRAFKPMRFLSADDNNVAATAGMFKMVGQNGHM